MELHCPGDFRDSCGLWASVILPTGEGVKVGAGMRRREGHHFSSPSAYLRGGGRLQPQGSAAGFWKDDGLLLCGKAQGDQGRAPTSEEADVVAQ